MARILDTLTTPAQLRAFSPEELAQLAAEMRQEIITTVSVNGGHLAPNLGTIELTLALHIAFDTPRDQLVWDIGHQAYPHKLVTGRVERFRSIKQLGGLSGYLSRAESPYDAFGASHASTSISAALGIAVARDLEGKDFNVVAIIGDGALTGGMALEAINNAGAMGNKLIVVINDNDKSISDNVGAIHRYLGNLRAHPRYRKLRSTAKQVLTDLPVVGDLAAEMAGRTQRSMKEFMLPSKSGVIFSELGFTFLGPFDGHDTQLMIDVFEKAKQLDGPIMIQVLTRKGRGYAPAEQDSTKFHGPGAFDPETGVMVKKVGAPAAYSDVAGDTLVEICRKDPNVVGITAAMAEGTGLYKLRAKVPEQYFDQGIAEQHTVTFAAGMATQGIIPVTAIYSTFMQRGYDQVLHDVCVQNLHVPFLLDRAGLVGEDGQTQHGIFDISYLRNIPNMHLMAPKDENELRQMIYTAVYGINGPSAVRFPRGAGVGLPISHDQTPLPIGKGEILTDSDAAEQADVVILGYGDMAPVAKAAADLLAGEGIQAAAVNPRWAKPLDEELILRLARATGHVITVENHMAAGGFGSAVLELLQANDVLVPVKIIGVKDAFIEHGSVAKLKEMCGLTPAHVAEVARAMVRTTVRR
ncbi:MAG: 1-deoxy-D-xylulose-5-phosphate synthase [Ktedonobacterales bacterium]|nr:1-deoxy-D-xylulose-5-phosphate synthase [Ktedonobacterales bacterium]